jgi:flagellar capping protein FliD
MGTVNTFGNVLLPAGSNTIDVQSLLNTAITAAQAPLTLLQQQQTTVQSQTTALQSISNDVATLNTAIQALTTSSGALDALDAASSNTNVLTASADSTALTGTHSIVVNSLATTASYYTDPVASATTTLANGFVPNRGGRGRASYSNHRQHGPNTKRLSHGYQCAKSWSNRERDYRCERCAVGDR